MGRGCFFFTPEKLRRETSQLYSLASADRRLRGVLVELVPQEAVGRPGRLRLYLQPKRMLVTVGFVVCRQSKIENRGRWSAIESLLQTGFRHWVPAA